MRQYRREIMLITAFGAVAVAGWAFAWNAAKSKSETQIAPVGSPSESSGRVLPVFNNTPIGTKSITDVQLWYDALGHRGFSTGGTFTTKPANRNTLDELQLSRRIVLVRSSVNVKVLRREGVFSFIEVAEGIHRGQRGYIAQEAFQSNDEYSQMRQMMLQPP